MNRAVIATDGHPDYAFYAPLAVEVWRQRGWAPLVLLVGDDEWEAPRLALVEESIGEALVNRIFSRGYERASRTSTVAQVSRLFAASCMGVEDDDHIITTDVDMLPIGPWIARPTTDRDVPKTFQIYYANAHIGDGHLHFPICYLVASVALWREAMRCDRDFMRSLTTGLARCRTREPRPSEVGLQHRGIPLAEWNSDEWLFAERLAKWPGYPDKVQFINRNLDKHGERRIDRSAWKDVPSLDGYADAHLPRPGYDDVNWPHVRHLLKLLLPRDKFEWAEDYRAAWVSLPEIVR